MHTAVGRAGCGQTSLHWSSAWPAPPALPAPPAMCDQISRRHFPWYPVLLPPSSEGPGTQALLPAGVGLAWCRLRGLRGGGSSARPPASEPCPPRCRVRRGLRAGSRAPSETGQPPGAPQTARERRSVCPCGLPATGNTQGVRGEGRPCDQETLIPRLPPPSRGGPEPGPRG